MLDTLRNTFSRDSSKQAALDYLEQFGESFWAETDERVREITTSFENQVKEVAGVSVDVPMIEGQLGIEGLTAATTTVRRELADRYQRLVNETQLSRLNKMIAVLNDDILTSVQNYTYVVIDDLHPTKCTSVGHFVGHIRSEHRASPGALEGIQPLGSETGALGVGNAQGLRAGWP